jgi:hypothetical protein
MIIGFDRGSNGIKVSYPNDTMYLPHLIGEGHDKIITSIGKGKPINSIDIIVEGKRYFVGEKAKDSFGQMVVFQKSHIHMATKVFLLSALALLPDNEFTVVLGLPIADFRTQRKDLARFMQGDYKVTLGGEEKRINVKCVSVYPQGVGALWSQYLNFNGNLYREVPDRCGIVDLGFKDMNFALLENGEFRDNQSWSFPIGLHTALMAAIPEMNGDYTINTLDPKKVPQKFYDNLQDKILNLINPYWKNQDFPIFMTGGGSYYVKIGQQLDNPVFANAIGFRKLGVLKYA